MNVSEAIAQRRSIRKFDDREPPRDVIEAILHAATLGPNHKLTLPWRFYVLGPDARAAYGRALGNRKAKKAADEAAANVIRDRTADEHRALPCMIAVAMVQSDNPETREEDYAAVMMSVEAIALLAVERGLGTHIKTGAVMSDPAARDAVGAGENERIVAIVNLGYPSETPEARGREGSFVTWVA